MSINLAVLPFVPVNYHRYRISPVFHVLPQPEPLNLLLYLPDSLNRLNVESFIYKQFRHKHNAKIRHFMPYLLSLEDRNRNVISAAGFRPACAGELFLEQYLDNQVESFLTKISGNHILRESVLEVGNLASDCPGSSRLMIMAMTYLFNQHGFEWVVMTGTNELLNIFANLELELVLLAHAEAERLADGQSDWGSYYIHNPRVMAGNIKRGHRKLAESDHYLHFIHNLHALKLPPCEESGN